MKATELIEAIGKQWPFVITIFLITVFLLKWKTIWSLIPSITGLKIKRGDTEIEFSKDDSKKNHLVEKEKEEISKTDIPTDKPSSEIDEDTLYGCYLKLSENKVSEADVIFNQIQSKANAHEKIENEFIYLFYKYINGYSVEQEFKSKINNDISSEQKALGFKYLGLGYKNTNQFDKAIDSYTKSTSHTKKETEICENAVNMSQCYLEIKEFESSKDAILKCLHLIDDDSNKAKMYHQLSKVYEAMGDRIMQITTLERVTSLMGNNTSYLFEAAYAYSKYNLKDASSYHYSKILNIDSKHSAALNNLGVNFQEKDLTFKSTLLYKKSADNGSSLAAANLADIYIKAGFDEEATKLFKNFEGKPGVHANLIASQSSLVTEKEKEEKEADEILEIGLRYSRFFNSFATSYFEHNEITNQNIEDWVDAEGNKVSITINENEIIIRWEKINSKLNDTDNYIIKGILHNSASIIIFEYPFVKEPSTFELALDKSKKTTRVIKKYEGYCYIDLKNKKLEVLYQVDEEYKFFNISKK